MAKLRNLSLMAVALAAVMLMAGWFLLVSPQRAKSAELTASADQARSATTALQTQLSMLKSQAKELPKQRARLAAIAAKVPNNPAEPALVRALTKAADQAGVDLTAISPAQPALATGTAAAPAAAPATGAAPTAGGAQFGPRVATLALRITAVGTYFELEQFQANLESLTRALKTTSISLTPGGGPATQGGTATTSGGYDGKVTAQISANVYMTVEGASTAPLSGVGATAPAPTK
jgi:type IV pilus assembly protein PilO